MNFDPSYCHSTFVTDFFRFIEVYFVCTEKFFNRQKEY